MDITFKVLLIVHLGALVVAAAANIALPVIGRQIAGATPDMQGRLGSIMKQLSLNGRLAVAALVLTGIAMLWLRYDGAARALGPWFIAKLVFVAVIVAAIALSMILPPERLPPRLLGTIFRISLIGVVVCAVMTFN